MRHLKAFITLAMLAAIGCTKEADIQLVHQPLGVIQERLTGKWRVKYMQGGLAGTRIERKDGLYFIFSATTIQYGDNNGERLNSAIAWQKVRWGNVGDSTWILNYGSTVYPNQLLVYGIENGVLQLEQYGVSDGFTYFLERW